MAELVLWGGTGQSRVIADALGDGHRIVAVFDNRDIASPFAGVPLQVGLPGLDRWLASRGAQPLPAGAVGIGGARGADRLALMAEFAQRGIRLIDVIHPRAHLASRVEHGSGLQLMAGAIIATGCRLGDGVIVNTAASVDHDGQLGHGVHLGPGARLAGEVIVGARAFIGTGAVVLPRIRIGDDAVIGAGAVVTRDVPPNTTVAGNPARPLAPRAQPPASP